jgi:rfaE bifunctional protein nucleotidyltransferase chain/domain
MLWNGMPVGIENKILPPNEARDWVRRQQAQGKKVVFTNGCFDLLHAGHVDILNRAKALGDVLMVAINTDASVCALKGPSRPVNAAANRAYVLAGLSAVDAITTFEDLTPVALLAKLQPDIHVKGGDYVAEALPEYPAVTAYGGKVVILPLREGHSTTSLIGKMRGSLPQFGSPSSGIGAV